MAAPVGIIVMWPGTNASIPSGWTRVTALDSKFPKGAAAAAEAGSTGGATTHSHTDGSHTHPIGSHSHSTYNTGAATGTGQDIYNTVTSTTGATSTHTHVVTPGAASGTSGASANQSSSSNLPTYSTVIYIQSNGTTDIPIDAVAFINDTSAPTGYRKADGTGGAPSYNGVYFYGASPGADAGSTGGALTTHTHTHDHGLGTHTHTASVGNPSATWNIWGTGSSPYTASSTHTHTISGASANASATSTGTATSSTGTIEPPYTTLLPVQATSSISAPQNLIVLWAGLIADIPTGWALCDGTNGTPDLREKYIKGNTAGAHSSGGAATHSHTYTAHTHTATHSHGAGTFSASTVTNDRTFVGGSTGVLVAANGHGHSVGSIPSGSATATSASPTVSTESNEPPYSTVQYIMKVGQTVSIDEYDASSAPSDVAVTRGAVTVSIDEYDASSVPPSIENIFYGTINEHTVSISGTAYLYPNDALIDRFLSGDFGNVVYEFKLYKTNEHLVRLEDISDKLVANTGSISAERGSIVGRTGQIELQDLDGIDLENHRFEIVIEYDFNGIPLEFKQGHFIGNVPTYGYSNIDTNIVLTLADIASLLTKPISHPVIIQANTNYTEALRTVASIAHFYRVAFPSTDLVTPNDFIWNPGTPWATVLSDLALGANMLPPWVCKSGFLRTRNRTSLEERAPDVVYTSDSDEVEGSRILIPPFNTTINQADLINEIIVQVNDPLRDPFWSTYYIENPESPVAIKPRKGIGNFTKYSYLTGEREGGYTPTQFKVTPTNVQAIQPHYFSDTYDLTNTVTIAAWVYLSPSDTRPRREFVCGWWDEGEEYAALAIGNQGFNDEIELVLLWNNATLGIYEAVFTVPNIPADGDTYLLAITLSDGGVVSDNLLRNSNWDGGSLAYWVNSSPASVTVTVTDLDPSPNELEVFFTDPGTSFSQEFVIEDSSSRTDSRYRYFIDFEYKITVAGGGVGNIAYQLYNETTESWGSVTNIVSSAVTVGTWTSKRAAIYSVLIGSNITKARLILYGTEPTSGNSSVFLRSVSFKKALVGDYHMTVYDRQGTQIGALALKLTTTDNYTSDNALVGLTSASIFKVGYANGYMIPSVGPRLAPLSVPVNDISVFYSYLYPDDLEPMAKGVWPTNIPFTAMFYDMDDPQGSPVNDHSARGFTLYPSLTNGQYDVDSYIVDMLPWVHLPLNDQIGATTALSGIGGVKGTYTGSPTLENASIVSNNTSTCVRLDGSTQYVTVDDDPRIRANETFSTVIFFKPDTLRIQGLIDKGNGVTNAWRIFMRDTAGSIAFDVDGGGTYAIQGNVETTTGGLNMVAVTYDHQTTTARLYVNGVLEGEITIPTCHAASAGALELAPSHTNRFDGYMQHFAYWNGVALTAEQIEELWMYATDAEVVSHDGLLYEVDVNDGADRFTATPFVINIPRMESQTQADLAAAYFAEEYASQYMRGEVNIGIDPRRCINEMAYLYIKDEDGNTVADGKWLIESWTMPLQIGGEMSMVFSRLEKF